MKSLLLTTLFLTLTTAANARSVVTHKIVKQCQTAQKVEGSELLIDVKEAGNGEGTGASILVLTFSGQDEKQTILTTKTLPPPGSVGGSIKYEGSDSTTGGKIILSIRSQSIRVGKYVGKSADLSAEGLFSNLKMVCGTVK